MKNLLKTKILSLLKNLLKTKILSLLKNIQTQIEKAVISTNKHKFLFSELTKVHVKETQELKKFYEKEIEEAKILSEKDKKNIDIIMEKLINLQWGWDLQEKNYPKMRLVLDFDSFYIEQLLMHGNDDDFINMLGHQIGSRASYEIRRRNIVRIPQDYKFNYRYKE